MVSKLSRLVCREPRDEAFNVKVYHSRTDFFQGSQDNATPTCPSSTGNGSYTRGREHES